MSYLFNHGLNGWESWARVYHDATAFAPLIAGILKKEGLPKRGLSLTSPGSNGVFRAGEYLVKVFAPPQAGAESQDDYQTELWAMTRAGNAGIATPRVLASGVVEDRYLFRYIVEEYIEGEDAGEALKSMAGEERQDFARQVRGIMDALHALPCAAPRVPLAGRIVGNPRWARLPKNLADELPGLIQAWEGMTQLVVHGDMTAENLRVTPRGKIYLLDFADSTVAPPDYEYAPILADLFRFDKDMFAAFAGKDEPGRVADALFRGMCMHSYGYGFVQSAARELMGIELASLPSLRALGRALAAWYGA